MPNSKTVKDFPGLAKVIKDLSSDTVLDSITGNSEGFAREQTAKFKRWGDDMYISPKQAQWLESIHEKHVGTRPTTVARPMRDDEADEDMNDEVPF